MYLKISILKISKIFKYCNDFFLVQKKKIKIKNNNFRVNLIYKNYFFSDIFMSQMYQFQ